MGKNEGCLRHILNNSSDLDCQTNELKIIEILEENEACKINSIQVGSTNTSHIRIIRIYEFCGSS
ncbi:14447_t:CDS:2 [Entrophospora sp. SA101]|nr:14447_t:CDS:2 [Entrophospora sp. SA101]